MTYSICIIYLKPDCIITSDMKTMYTNAIDALLENTALVVPFKLIFGDTKWTDCVNCHFSSTTGRSSNVWDPNSPVGANFEFHTGICGYCGGLGRTPTADTFETLSFCVIWDYKSWINWNGSSEGSRSPEGFVQTMSAMSTITKIKKAKEIIINTDIDEFVTHRFTRDGEPNPCGFGASSYIFTMWKRAG